MTEFVREYQLFSSQITIPEGNDNDSENVDKLCSDGMASTALESTHSNTEEPSMETSSFQTDQLEVASVNASYDAKSVPEAWSEKTVCFKEEKEIINIWEEGE